MKSIKQDEIITIQKEEKVNVTKLEKKIIDLKEEIKNVPKLKTKPDQETLDYWNAFAVYPTEPIEHDINLKEKELAEYKKIMKK